MTPNILEGMKWVTLGGNDGPPAHEFTWIDLGVMDFTRFNTISEKFNNGEVPVVFHTPTLPQDVPMPFEKIGLVIDHTVKGAETFLCMTLHRDENDMQAVFRHSSGKELLITQKGEYSIKGGKDLWYDGTILDVLMKQPKYKDKTEQQIVESFIQIARRTYACMFLSFMNKKKPLPAYTATPNPANEKRIRKGKRPLFEWKVIDVTAQHAPSTGKTGRSHASPRRHVRRGHQRKLPSGRVVWVKQMWVGKIEFGYIHHSYTTGETNEHNVR